MERVERRASLYPAPAKPPAADMSLRNWRKINNYLNIWRMAKSSEPSQASVRYTRASRPQMRRWSY